MELGGPSKTPVSLLQEICTRKNINPKYDLLQVEGAVHEPIFQYRLTVEVNEQVFEETGCGRSKKEAKHNTALAMLRAMDVVPKEDFTGKSGNDAFTEFDDFRSTLDGDLGGNPVGLLQELCMKMKFPAPTYEVHSEEGLPHERIFALACKVGEHYVEIGKGKSKKLAKRQAAHLMAERLRTIPSEKTNVHSFDEDDDQIVETIHAVKDLEKIVKGSLESEVPIFLLKQFQSNIQEKLPSLKDKDFVIQDPIKYLQKMENSSFKAVYIDFDEISKDGKYHCLVQITTDPPLVAYGVADTIAKAKMESANRAINILRECVQCM